MTPAIDDHLARLGAALKQLAVTSDEAREHAKRGEERELALALARMRDQWQPVRVATRRIGAGGEIPATLDELGALCRAREHATEIGCAIDTIATRRGAGEQTPGMIADALLPPSWDRSRDVFVLGGPTRAALADALVARQQRRIIVVGDGERRADWPEDVLAAEDAAGARGAIDRWAEDPPTNIYAYQCPDGIGAELEYALAAVASGRGTVASFASLWVRQGIANMISVAHLPTVLDMAPGLFAGRPMIILGAGPSLARNIEQAKALQGRAVIVAVSHALGACQRAGLTPNVSIVVDPEDARYHFDGYPVADLDTLILAATAHPSLYQLPARQILTVAANGQNDRWLYEAAGAETPIVPAGGTVTSLALMLGARWGCDPIVFLGQDLAFADDGHVYAAGTIDDGTHAVPDAGGGE